jgi:hypothetical protein
MVSSMTDADGVTRFMERRPVGVIEASLCSPSTLEVLGRLTNLPAPWVASFYENGEELASGLREMPLPKRLIAVMPTDLGIPYDLLSMLARRANSQVLIIVGVAHRTHEDRCAHLYGGG